MWEIKFENQIISFLSALMLGAILSLIFDFLRGIRKVIKHSEISIFIEDVIFSVFSAFMTFLLLLSRCNGEIRAYMLIGISAGFFAYRCTLSRFVFLKIIVKFFGLLYTLCEKISFLTDSLGKYLEEKISVLYKLNKKIYKKLIFKRKNS